MGIEKFNKNRFIKNMKDIKEYLFEAQGEHDKSKVYDDLYSDIENYLDKWGAGPVYGWRSDQGIAFSVSNGKNVEKDDWIVIVYNKKYDDLTIMLSKYGTGDEEDAKAIERNVYAGQEPMIIDKLLGIK